MIINGKAIAETIEEEIKTEIIHLKNNHPHLAPPGLAVVLIGSNPASLAYVTMKKKACLSVGIHSEIHHFDQNITELELLEIIAQFNENPLIDGLLIQLPLPKHIDPSKVNDAISANKDVDGFHPLNLGKVLLGRTDGFLPCTPNGIKILLERSGINVSGKHVVIVGRSTIVGKPLAALLMQNAPYCNATVTIAHSFTTDLKSITSTADVLVAAIGIPHFIKADMVKESAFVIDVGINRVKDENNPKGYSLVGDVDFENVRKKCAGITPVPKGVGPMTIAMLLQNTLISYKRKNFL